MGCILLTDHSIGDGRGKPGAAMRATRRLVALLPGVTAILLETHRKWQAGLAPSLFWKIPLQSQITARSGRFKARDEDERLLFAMGQLLILIELRTTFYRIAI